MVPQPRILNKSEKKFSRSRRRLWVIMRKDRKTLASFAFLPAFIILLIISVTVLPVSSFDGPVSYETELHSTVGGTQYTTQYGMVVTLPHGGYFNISYILPAGIETNYSVQASSTSPLGQGKQYVVESASNVSGTGAYSYFNSNSTEEVVLEGTLTPYSAHPNATITANVPAYYSASLNPYPFIASIISLLTFSIGLGIRMTTILSDPDKYFGRIEPKKGVAGEYKSYSEPEQKDKPNKDKPPSALIFVGLAAVSLAGATLLNRGSNLELLISFIMYFLTLIFVSSAFIFWLIRLGKDPE